MTDLRGRDLDRAIAELMGRGVGKQFGKDVWVSDDGSTRALPTFTTSLDALYHGPERLLREAGWSQVVSVYPSGLVTAEWFKERPRERSKPRFELLDWKMEESQDGDQAAARALAVYAALRALKGDGNG